MQLRLALPLLPLWMLLLPAWLTAFSAGPLPQLTGGFKEQTCVRCHSSFPLNEGRTQGGLFHVAGVPRTYSAGTVYPITVVIGQPGQSRWGFELSVRHVATGAQAGQLVPVDSMTQVKEAGGVQYIEHTATGNRRGMADGPVEFRLNWIAPNPTVGPVFLNAARNAANSSGDPAGDYIYTAGAFSNADGAAPALVTESQREEKPVERLNTATRLLHLPYPKDLKKGSLLFNVQHRFLGAIVDSRPGNAFGLDMGANINLELVCAPADNLSFSVSRARSPWLDRALCPRSSITPEPTRFTTRKSLSGRCPPWLEWRDRTTS